MIKTRSRRKSYAPSLSNDVEKIKKAIGIATLDAKDIARGMIADSLERARQKATSAQDAVSDYTVEKPFKSLGIALATGVLIGFLFRR